MENGFETILRQKKCFKGFLVISIIKKCLGQQSKFLSVRVFLPVLFHNNNTHYFCSSFVVRNLLYSSANATHPSAISLTTLRAQTIYLFLL
jgi:hypothetical protein